MRSPRLLAFLVLALCGTAQAYEHDKHPPREIHYAETPAAPRYQTAREAQDKSAGCGSCHTATDHASMHVNPGVMLGCTDCHGGSAGVVLAAGLKPEDAAYRKTLDQAHVQPRYPDDWHYPSSANPQGSYTLLNRESPEFIRFVNPGDYRVAREACGACHLPIIEAAERSLMSNGAMFFEGAAYNNGILPFKRSIIGETYTRDGQAAVISDPDPAPDANETAKGVLAKLFPLPPWEVVPQADVFRIFERGGRNISNLFPETGLPDSTGEIQKLEEPGRPDFRQSNRGPGTGNRIAVPVINLTKTRLNDPYMWFLGTSEQPGDYRSSGCSGCHVVYANDRDPLHSGPYAKFGNDGTTQTVDPTIPRNQPGHPLQHVFTRSIPTEQCMVCHMHQPNIFLNSMLGYTMWDYESDAPAMWPEKQRYPSDSEIRAINQRNPEEAAIRGKWSDGVPQERLQPQPLAEGHPVRRLPRPRLELPRHLQARPQGRPARQGRQDRRRRRPAQVRPGQSAQGGAADVDPRREGHAVHRLPLLAGHARQRPHLRRGGPGDRDRLPGLPRHGRQLPDPAQLRARRPGAEVPGGRQAPARRLDQGREPAAAGAADLCLRQPRRHPDRGAAGRHRPGADAHPGRAPALRMDQRRAVAALLGLAG
ncbi:MAG TPA: hypothetical protein VNX47_09920 [Nevskia sp.]|nr:hypothetical protein [Nevskia sp.]